MNQHDYVHEIIAKRSSDDEFTFARITFKGEKRLSDGEALRLVTKVLTKWRATSKEGAEAWEYSSEDFNVGDLGVYQNLVPAPLWWEVGISEFKVQTFCIDSRASNAWTYDTVLMEEVKEI